METMPMGTSKRLAMASLKGGMKLPPLPLAPPWGSSAICHFVPSKEVTMPDCTVSFFSP